MQFRTEVPIAHKPEKNIGYQSHIVSVGSCFSEHIASKLAWYQFPTVANPLGIFFHSQALENIIRRALTNDFFTENDFFQHNDLWQNYDLHSQMSHPDLTFAVENSNQSLRILGESLERCTHLLITLGTAWVYTLADGKIVANCHKVPQTHFRKRLLSPEEITLSLERIFSLLQMKNPEVQIILTVSPVRHLKDGFTENQRSKAHIITAIHQFIEKNMSVDYFPSYEIITDELRDYRFYADDLVHPSGMAIGYIWERFCQGYMLEETLSEMKIVQQIQQGLAHRPFNPETASHIAFLKKITEKIEAFKKRHKGLKVTF